MRNGIFSISIGPGFLPRTVVMIVTLNWVEFLGFDHAKVGPKVGCAAKVSPGPHLTGIPTAPQGFS